MTELSQLVEDLEATGRDVLIIDVDATEAGPEVAAEAPGAIIFNFGTCQVVMYFWLTGDKVRVALIPFRDEETVGGGAELSID